MTLHFKKPKHKYLSCKISATPYIRALSLRHKITLISHSPN